jgi:FHS family glucose/mannose:H+ symporter-like MFS transporter
MGINGWLSLFLEQKLNLSKMTAGSFLSYFWTAITVGRIFSAYFSKKISPEVMLLFLTISGLLSFLFFINANNSFYSAFAIILVGLSFSGMFPIFIILGGKYFRENIGKTTSILMTYLGIGFMTIPWLVGVVKQYRSLQDGMNFLFVTFIFLLLVVIVIYFKSKSQKEI